MSAPHWTRPLSKAEQDQRVRLCCHCSDPLSDRPEGATITLSRVFPGWWAHADPCERQALEAQAQGGAA